MRADDEVRKIILIEGAPGSGKSTLAWHICQQWEKGELFTEYEVVVFVQLRDLRVQSATTFADILPVPSQHMRTAIASLLSGENRWGKGVLLILDGWDELQPDCPARFLFLQLIQFPENLNLHASSLIITSRPITSGELQHHVSSRVEVLGFKPEQVHKYFKASFGTDHQLYTKFVAQLRERCIIEASCYLPLIAVVVVHIFLVRNHSLPHTLHEVFEKLVISCIVRHVTDRGKVKTRIGASCLNDLPPDIEVHLSALSSLAFLGICLNKVVFSEADIRAFKFPVDLDYTLSLLQVVENFDLCGHSKSYNFFHLQIQELLAAYHISKLEEDEQVKIIQDLFEQPRFGAVFQFYAAFTKLQAEGIRQVLVDMLKTRKYSYTVLQCVYEAQDPSLCQCVGNALCTGKGYTFCLWPWSSPLHIIALGYFLCYFCYYCTGQLSLSFHNVVKIQLLVKEFLKQQSFISASSPHHQPCGFLAFILTFAGKRYGEAPVQGAFELISSLKPFIIRLVFDIHVHDNTRLSTVISNLSTLVQNASSLQHLEVHSYTKKESSAISIEEPDLTFAFAQSIHSNEQLHSFTLDGVKLQLSLSTLKAVCSAMATNSSIKYLTLHDCQFDLAGPPMPLFHAIPLSEHLRVINLTGTYLGRCVSPLLMGLASNTSVVELILEKCSLDFTGENGQALCNMLRTNTTLRALNLCGDIWDRSQSVDLQSICFGLTFNTSLAYLDLSGCELTVTTESGPALANMLQTNVTLRSLKLNYNYKISNEGAVYLAWGLAQNRGLRILSIVQCGISTAVVELVKAIKTNRCLLSLDMSGNDLGESFIHLGSHQFNSTLQDLRASKCGIQHIATVDIVKSSLKAIDLSWNSIGDEGAEKVAQLVTKSCSLYKLNLGHCDIGDRGVECLAAALEVNTSLEVLHIPFNMFTHMSLLALGNSLRRNISLKTLDVAGCHIAVGWKQFVLCLCENEYLTELVLSCHDEVRDEINKVNQIRQEMNCNTLNTF